MGIAKPCLVIYTGTMLKRFMWLLLILMLALPALPEACAATCEKLHQTCCCCEETEDSTTSAQISDYFSCCKHDCAITTADDLATSLPLQVAVPHVAPVLSSAAVFNLLPVASLPVIDSVSNSTPLHLASNKIYLKKRSLLI